MNDKVDRIIKQSDGLRKICGGIGYRYSIGYLLDYLYQNTEWNRTTPVELWSLLWAMQEYAFKYQIVDFYEMVLRFTLSECFREEY